jgi:MFS family permease
VFASAFSLLLANRAVRTFGYGLTSVVIGLYLLELGAGPTVVLLALGLSLASGATLNVLVGYYGDRFGRRRAMVLFGLLMGTSGAVLALAPTFSYALVGLALGAISPSGSEVGPFLSLEQSVIAEIAPTGRRTNWYAVYNLLGSLAAAVGALATILLTGPYTAHPASLANLRFAFVAFGLLGGATALLSACLPSAVEGAAPSGTGELTPESRRRVSNLSALFAVDAFAGGIVVQSFVALWFVLSFPSESGAIGAIFFGAGVASALSFLVAARLAARFGLVETMVFTHLPSNVLLILVPLAPTFGLALGLFLARMSLSQMDVPTRQAYLAGIVEPRERTKANAWTNGTRNVAQAAGPFSASTLVALAGLSSPFFLGGALKIAYDLAVYRGFRGIRPGPEHT